MAERDLTERDAFRAARYFLEEFNERERSDAIMLLIGWMSEGTWEHDPLETNDPAQWGKWSGAVDRVVAARLSALDAEHDVQVIESTEGPVRWRCSCGAGAGGWFPTTENAENEALRYVRSATGADRSGARTTSRQEARTLLRRSPRDRPRST
jgi:hypothetical protein